MAVAPTQNLALGPVEYIVVEFSGNQFNSDLVPALVDLVKSNTIRILDLLFVRTHADGSFEAMELDALPPLEATSFDNLDGDILGLLNGEDIELLAKGLEPNSSAALLVFENVWAKRLRDAVVSANGRLVDNARIPAAVVAAAMAAADVSSMD
jgi:hypothetical protein